MDELKAQLREACNGHPHAKIPWPHRLLHEAHDGLAALEAERDKYREALEFYADKNSWKDIIRKICGSFHLFASPAVDDNGDRARAALSKEE